MEISNNVVFSLVAVILSILMVMTTYLFVKVRQIYKEIDNGEDEENVHRIPLQMNEDGSFKLPFPVPGMPPMGGQAQKTPKKNDYVG